MASNRFRVTITTLVGFLSVVGTTFGTDLVNAAELKLVAKPTLQGAVRRARQQPTVPSEYKELPFIETAPEPVLTSAERQRGYLLFHRPITVPVYPNTHPLPHERFEQLVAFATPGELEPVTFSIFPTRDLANLHVQVSDFKGDHGTIPSTAAVVRLVTYWNVGFPRYTSRDTYRRLPELLERVTVHDAPAGECQRWWITIRVPTNAEPGLYHATVTVSDDGFERAVAIPLELRVLEFSLRRDPAKHYSVYYNCRNRVQFQGKDEAFIKKATGNEYRAMIDYGIDTVPTLALQTDETGQKIVLRDPEELKRMLALGLKGPVPVTAGNVIGRIYRDTTPGGERGSHWTISKMPPSEFYERVRAMFEAFETQRKKNGWPAFVCCPLDEVAASHKQFGSRVYRAVHDAGVRTYATKNPLAPDAEVYLDYVDVWCSQPYSASYEKIVSQDRYEYWCYPNHNAGEIKDRRVMCKGGRMTYGFGFWRSGYTTLIPWHWAWTPEPDQFDYLRGRRSGCGQRIGEDGEVIPAIYWECFREGRDDARYVYTLQQAAWQREITQDARCRDHVVAAQQLLQETWDAIYVQQKYLADGMWPDEEFNARRWRLAMAIRDLLRFPPVREGDAPSVLVADTVAKKAEEKASIIQQAMAEGNVQIKDLGDGFKNWRNGTKEGDAQLTRAASQDEKEVGLRWRVAVDHKRDGGEGGKYPVGWPRIARSFGKNELDMSDYDYLEIVVRVDSDRDEVADDSTPLGLSLTSHEGRLLQEMRDLGDRQRTWIPLRYSIKEMIDKVGRGLDPWKSVARVQFFISEGHYGDGTHLSFDIAHVRLLRFKSPVITRLDAPRFVLVPKPRLPIAFELMGTASVRSGSHRVEAKVVDARQRVCLKTVQDLGDSRLLVLNTADLKPGRYRLEVKVLAADGKLCSKEVTSFDALPGPLAEGG